MIAPTAPLSITHQCALLALSRASYYWSRVPRQEDADLALNDALTSIYERHPYYGNRRMQLALRDAGWYLGIRPIRRLLRELGLVPLHPRPRTSVPSKTHDRTHTCSASVPSRRRMTSGQPTLRTFPCVAVTSMWCPSWTGTAAGSWHGGCRIPWMRVSASRR